MLVPRIGGLEGIKIRANFKNNVDKMLELDVVHPWPHIDAVAGVVADAVSR